MIGWGPRAALLAGFLIVISACQGPALGRQASRTSPTPSPSAAARVSGAVAAGARAVQARPATPLAHVFYSEALADVGRFSESERELRAAEPVVAAGYQRSELDREWANLYRDRGQYQSELNYLELAVK